MVYFRDAAVHKMICVRCGKKNVETKCTCGCYAAYYKKRVTRTIRAR